VEASGYVIIRSCYQWADGIYVKAGLERDKAALLVIIGGLTDGRKVLLACENGYGRVRISWSAILRNLKMRGLSLGRLTIADGHLGLVGLRGTFMRGERATVLEP